MMNCGASRPSGYVGRHNNLPHFRSNRSNYQHRSPGGEPRQVSSGQNMSQSAVPSGDFSFDMQDVINQQRHITLISAQTNVQLAQQTTVKDAFGKLR